MTDFEKNFPRIQELCQSGDDAFEDDDLESALDDYLEAWELIPQEPEFEEACVVAKDFDDFLEKLFNYEIVL